MKKQGPKFVRNVAMIYHFMLEISSLETFMKTFKEWPLL